MFRKLTIVGQTRDDVKEELVWQFSDGRTKSLRELRKLEYDALCDALQREVGGGEELVKRLCYRLELKGARSVVLKLMQRMGIDTTDWHRINDFCRDPRICGVEFRRLDVEALKALAVKLRAIERKGGLGDRRSSATSYKLQATSDGAATSDGVGAGNQCVNNIKVTVRYERSDEEKGVYGEC